MNISCREILAALFILAIASCASTVTRPAPDRYFLRANDNVKAHRFDIVLKSNDDKALCISTNGWPNSSGLFTTEREDVALETSAGVLPAKSALLSAYCPGGCGEHRIGNKGELHGFIAYEAFGDAEKLAKDLNKKLKFQVFPYYCH